MCLAEHITYILRPSYVQPFLEAHDVVLPYLTQTAGLKWLED